MAKMEWNEFKKVKDIKEEWRMRREEKYCHPERDGYFDINWSKAENVQQEKGNERI